MNKFLVSILTVVALLLAPLAHAVSSAAVPIRVIYANTPVSSSVFKELVHSTAKGVASVSVLNTGAFPVKIAVGAAGSEVTQMVAPGTINTIAQLPVNYPLSTGYGARISVISLNGTNSTGELEVNLFYN